MVFILIKVPVLSPLLTPLSFRLLVKVIWQPLCALVFFLKKALSSFICEFFKEYYLNGLHLYLRKEFIQKDNVISRSSIRVFLSQAGNWGIF